MEIVDVAAGSRDAADDGARGHGQRARDRARRVHVHAGRLGLRVRLQLLQPQHRRGRRGDPVPRADPARRRAGRRGGRAQPRGPRRGLRHQRAVRRTSRGRGVRRPQQGDPRDALRPRSRRRQELDGLDRPRVHGCPTPRPERAPRMQLERLRETLARVYEHVPHYRRAFDDGRRDARRPHARWPTSRGSRSPTKADLRAELPVRHVRGAARAGQPRPRLHRYDGQADRRRATRTTTSTPGPR